tara:strand:- start:4135 stop:4320 length:186 start_codon:yes stop_codon:yes gene_type:complete
MIAAMGDGMWKIGALSASLLAAALLLARPGAATGYERPAPDGPAKRHPITPAPFCKNHDLQ